MDTIPLILMLLGYTLLIAGVVAGTALAVYLVDKLYKLEKRVEKLEEERERHARPQTPS